MKKFCVILCILCLFVGCMPVCFAEEPAYRESLVVFPNGDHYIPSTVCIPIGEGPFPAVVMLHGTASNRNAGGIYTTAAHTFAEKYGVASIRIDFMGCGESREDFTRYTFDSAESDASAAAEVMQTLRYIDPERIGVLGWSQGGTNALLCAAHRPELFKSVVTWAGAPDLNIDPLFNDEKYQEAKKNGFFWGDLGWGKALKVPLQWCEDVLHTDVLGEFKEKYSGPVLAIQGTKDTVVDPIWCERIAAASENPASASLYIEGANHTFSGSSEEDSPIYSIIDATGEFFSKTLK